MAQITISRADHGPVVPLNVGGANRRLPTGELVTVSLEEIRVLDAAGVVYERYWRSSNSTLAVLTLDVDEVAEDAAADTVVGALVGVTSGSTLEMTDDSSGLFALDGLDVVVADALDYETAASHNIDITETNDEIESSPRTTTIAVTVTDVDEVAPTITSAATANNDEGTVLAHALTADETVTWAITGGVDAAQFEISGSTLRWAANGVQDFAAPADADTNNTYIVEVTATDTALNASTPQVITVTVNDVV